MSEKFYNIDEQRRWNEDYMWTNDGHEWSELFKGTDALWNEYIFEHVREFRNRNILEIAPGRGRMTQYLMILAKDLKIIDLNQSCIEICKKKFGSYISGYYVNDGKSLHVIQDNSQDLVFSFDSFVHMHRNVTEEYIKEIRRVLNYGGKAYIHHSWFREGSEYSTNNIAGRANMSPELFKEMVESNKMNIITQFPINFSEVTDCITIFEKI